MTDEKLFHVACVVRQAGLYDLLRAMELHKVGNLEVRAVAPVLALPAPTPKKNKSSHSGQQEALLAVLQPGQTFSAKEIGPTAGMTTKQAASAINNMMINGSVRRVSYGKYRLSSKGNNA